MHEQVKNDIIAVLSDFLEILKVKEDADISQVRELSNHVIHNASVFQDEDSISIAILIYSISKIMERMQKDLDYSKIIYLVAQAVSSAKKNDEYNYQKSIKALFSFIRQNDKRLRLFVHEVINQAQIKKGCKLCEHGISVARASEVIGISQWELMGYIGKTTIGDKISDPLSISQRLKFARKLFS